MIKLKFIHYILLELEFCIIISYANFGIVNP